MFFSDSASLHICRSIFKINYRKILTQPALIVIYIPLIKKKGGENPLSFDFKVLFDFTLDNLYSRKVIHLRFPQTK